MRSRPIVVSCIVNWRTIAIVIEETIQIAMIARPAGHDPQPGDQQAGHGRKEPRDRLKNCSAPKTAGRRSTGTSSTNRHSKLGMTT